MKLSKQNGLNAWTFECEPPPSQEYLIASSAGFQALYEGTGFKRKFVCWYTKRARVALKVAGYMHDDSERTELLALARKERDPGRVSITFDGADYRWYGPEADPWRYKDAPQFAAWQLERGYATHDAYWWTQDIICAVICCRHAIEHLDPDEFVIEPEALAMIEGYLRDCNSPPLDYTPPEIAPLVLPEKTTQPPETLKVRKR